LSRALPAAELVNVLWRETTQALGALQAACA
jgi:hypothetical protein